MAEIEKNKTQPNFIFIYPDSLGANALGCYGNEVVKTPHMDTLAAGGVRFSRCTTPNSVCMPSRGCLHTGRYIPGHGLRHNGCGSYLPHLVTFAQSLRGAGYHLGYYGKTHSLNQDEWDDVFDLYPDYNHYLAARGIDVHYPENPPVADLCAGVSKIGEADFPEVVLGRLGEHYIHERAKQSSKPFFLFMSHESPHSPWTIPPEDVDLYDQEEMPLLDLPEEDFQNKQSDRLRYMKKRFEMHNDRNLKLAIKSYLSLVTLVDRQVGRLIKALDETGLRDNTIVVVMADHGDLLGNHRSMGKSWSLDQSLIHIPMIFNAPDRFQPQVNTSMVESIDFFPTLMDLAGIVHPRGLQGCSLVPLLTGASQKVRDYGHSEEYSDKGVDMATVVGECYKLTIFSDGFEELYDLKNDPYEWYNLAQKQELFSIKAELKDEMIQWRFRSVDRSISQEDCWVTEFIEQTEPKY